MTVREVAEVTGAAYSTVAGYAQKAGWTENGRQTLLTENQVTLIVEAMRQQTSSGAKSNLLFQMEGVETTKSRALRVDLLHKQIEAELNAEITELKAENAALAPKAAYHDALVARDHLTNFRDTAKELDMKQTDFINALVERGYIYRDNHGDIKPYADKIEYFAIREWLKGEHAGTQTLVTAKGRERFFSVFRKQLAVVA
jgi:phage antirepressor YoqD-like protein